MHGEPKESYRKKTVLKQTENILGHIYAWQDVWNNIRGDSVKKNEEDQSSVTKTIRGYD